AALHYRTVVGAVACRAFVRIGCRDQTAQQMGQAMADIRAHLGLGQLGQAVTRPDVIDTGGNRGVAVSQCAVEVEDDGTEAPRILHRWVHVFTPVQLLPYGNLAAWHARLVYRGMEPSTRNGELTETPMAVGGAAEAAQSRACKKGPGGRFRIQPPLQQALRKTEPPDSWQNQTMVFPQPIRHERCGWNILRPPTVPRRRQP